MTTPASTERTIFLEAIEKPSEAERNAFVEGACLGNPQLKAEVHVLLRAHQESGDLLDAPEANFPTIDQPPRELLGTHIGRYKLLEQVGEGGMGVVYVAEQSEPVRRRVALKIIKPGMDTKQVIARFEAERQALAMMDHPNIAKIFDAGMVGQSTTSEARNTKRIQSTKHEARNDDVAAVSEIGPSNLEFVSDFEFRASSFSVGRPYFVMELVRGMPITEYCDKVRLGPRQRLELFVDVCQAVQHAHQKGIIHRDLKPSNVMVTMQDGRPVVKVIDFGVAKAVGQQLTERTVYTALTQLVGTPLYMSPEQAELTSHDVDTRSDVYSLGVLLYELLTGQTPFDKETLSKAGFDEMRRMIREDEPPRPSRRFSTLGAAAISTASQHRGVDERRLSKILCGELDWIVMKALEKDRSRRYESASALATDIQRYLSDEPVLACPPTTMYRLQKFARKHQPALATSAAIVACLILGTTVSAWQAVRATTAEAQATANASQAQEKAKEATEQRDESQKQRDEVKALADRLQRALYLSNMNLAQHTLEAGNGAGRVRELLEQHRPKPGDADLRGFEWFYLYRQCHGYILTIKDGGTRYSPDGKRLMGRGKAWDAQTGQELFNIGQDVRATVSPDGRRLASLSPRNTGGERMITVWDSQTGRELLTFKAPPAVSERLAFSHDGKRLAGGSQGSSEKPEEAVIVWDAESGREVLTMKSQTRNDVGWGVSMTFSPDGKRLASGRGQMGDLVGQVKMWDAETGKELLDYVGGGALDAVTFSADSKLLVSRSGKQAKVWDAPTGRELLTLQGHAREVEDVAISPDGKRLASASYDQTVKVWDTSTGRELRTLAGHTGGARKVAFSPDSTRLASRDERNVKIWDVQTGQKVLTFEDIGFGYGSGMSFSPDGKRMVIGYRDGTVRVWDAASDPKPLTIQTGAREDTNVAFSPDGSRVAGAASNNLAKIWDTKTGQELLSLAGHTERVACVTFSPDGKRLATGSWSRRFGEVKVWDSQTGQLLLTLKGHAAGIYGVAFSPDGKLLASGSTQSNVSGPFPGTTKGHVKVWDAITGQELRTFDVNSNCVVFSPDGKRLASGSGTHVSLPHETKVWDIETGRELLVLQGHNRGVKSVAFSPDGKLLASASGDYTGDNTIKLWDAQAGQELLTLDHVVPALTSIAFSPDGKRLASSSSDKTIKLWDVQTGQELLTIKGHTGGIDSVAFSPIGHQLASASWDGTVKIYDATPLPERP